MLGLVLLWSLLENFSVHAAQINLTHVAWVVSAGYSGVCVSGVPCKAGWNLGGTVLASGDASHNDVPYRLM